VISGEANHAQLGAGHLVGWQGSGDLRGGAQEDPHGGWREMGVAS
jgi:hypothetical protein